MNNNDEVGCPTCNNPVQPSNKFCSGCGTAVCLEWFRITIKCPTCSAVLEENTIFCPDCGTKVPKARETREHHPKPLPGPASPTASSPEEKNLSSPKCVLENSESGSASSKPKRRSVLGSMGESFMSQLENKLSKNSPPTLSRKLSTRKEPDKISETTNGLKMNDFYPKKLSWMDVVTLRGSHPAPGFAVIEKLMMSDYRAPYAASASSIKNYDNSGKKSPSDIVDLSKKFQMLTKITEAKKNEDLRALHPMDVMNVIYNCCDNIVLQILMEKQFLCRLSIPLLCPDFQSGRFVFCLWSLRGITPRIKCESEELKEKPLVEISQAFFAFLRIGRLHVSKSKLLNEILSSKHHNTFFHRDCEFGMSNRIDSEGSIEASWYFPADGESRGLKNMFTILNLRGEAMQFKEQAIWLCKYANLVFLMLDLVSLRTKSYFEFSKSCRNSQSKTIVCFVAASFSEIQDGNDDMSSCFEDLKTSVEVVDVLCNWNGERLLSAGEWKAEIEKVIDGYLKGEYTKINLEYLSQTIPGTKFTLDEDEPLCKDAFVKVKPFSGILAKPNFNQRKPQLLPLQGKLWRKWGQLKKEQYRNTSPNQEIEKFIASKKTEQNQMRNEQFEILQTSQSHFIADIFQQLEKSGGNLAKQYFIGWLQITLNNSSRKIIPFLQNNYYEKLKENRQKSSNSSTENEKNLSKTELDELADKLENASLGLEHIFREFGQIYEAVDSHMLTHSNIQNNQQVALQFPKVVASLILQGIPFELMDGDAAFVPLTWVKAVLQAIKNIIGDKKVFIISVIGIQSSGKSTLLNTMFGLKFAVSAGRCTRGLYFQLIPVDKASMDVEYDYLLVIDTEGLRAPELLDAGQVHDNELATLVIGLGDVTIVNVKGENISDMNDVLQIVIHAMIRIKLVRPNLLTPSCLFVHQNVPAVDAEDMLRVEQEKLLARLDKITVASAAEEKITHIQHFKDVISFDEKSYSHYMPDLWQGQPPMAPLNYGYSEKVNKIKTLLTKVIPKQFNPKTITSFEAKLSDLWEAILSENFVFSFKNSEEVKSFSSLDQAFVHLYWEFKEESLKLQVYCQNVVTSVSAEDMLKEISLNLEEKISTELREKNRSLRIDLNRFFDTQENKEILEQWRARYEINLENVCKDEQNRITSALHENVRRRIKQLRTTSEASVFCRNRIVETATKAAKELKERIKELSDDELSRYFYAEWPKWLENFQSKSDETSSEQDVLLAFRTELFKCFPSHIDFLTNELIQNPLEIYDQHQFVNFLALANKEDLVFCDQTGKKKKVSKKGSLRLASSMLNEISKVVKSYIQARLGEDFHSGQASHIVKVMKQFFCERDDQKEESSFTFGHKFLIAFTVKVSRCAINEILKNVRHFQEENNPLADIRKRESDFLRLFKNTYQDIAKEHSAADWFITDIAKWLHAVVSTKMGPLIVNAVLTDKTNCFDTKQMFMNRLLTEIGETKNFTNYLYYICAQESFFRNEIQRHVEATMIAADALNQTKSKLEVVIENELQQYSLKIKTALEKLSQNVPFIDLNDYFSKFKRQLDAQSSEQTAEVGMLCDAGNLGMANSLEITNFVSFTQLMLEKLPSIPIMIMHVFKYPIEGNQTSIYSNLLFASGTDPADVLAEKVLGCMERCPFCKAPCKYTFKNHAGDHSALQHCPVGVIGWHNVDDEKLLTHNCQSAVGSDMNFVNKDTGGIYVPFKDYRNYYPNWEIAPDRKMESSLFWKWFMYTFHDDLVSSFKVQPADIPNEWKEISWERARKSLTESY